MDKIIFCSSTGHDRKEEPEDLFASIKMIYPEAICYFDAIDFHFESIKRLQNMGVIVNSFKTSQLPPIFSDTRGRERIVNVHNKKIGYESNSAYGLLCAAWRLFMLPRLMKELDKPLLWLDSDCLVRGDLGDFMGNMLAHDVSVVIRPKSRFVVLSSVVGINNTPKGKEYLESLDGIYRDTWEEAHWGADPITLWKGIQKTKPRVWEFRQQHYNDSKFRAAAKIWHAKHGGKTHPRWLSGVAEVRKK